MTTPKVSEDIDAWCIKCKMFLNHVIMTMKETRPHRVKCKTCRDVHAFRLVAPGTAKAKTAKTPRKNTAARTRRINDFEAMIDGRDTAKAIPYTMKGKFKPDDLIDHKKFGLGLVIRKIDPTKMEVSFSEGTKILVFGR
jgi:hypothetical protein